MIVVDWTKVMEPWIKFTLTLCVYKYLILWQVGIVPSTPQHQTERGDEVRNLVRASMHSRDEKERNKILRRFGANGT